MRPAAWLVLLVLAARQDAFAEAQHYEQIRVDCGMTGSTAAISDRNGVGFVAEIKVNVHDNIALGGRVELAVMFGGQVHDEELPFGMAEACRSPGSPWSTQLAYARLPPVTPRRPDKQAILDAVRARVDTDLEAVTSSQRETHAGATHEESRPESDKDTRALEASYLARGLAQRVSELAAAAADLAAVALRDFAPGAAIALTALAQVEDDDGRARWYFLLPAAGGVKVDVSSQTFHVVTPASPLGRALVGKRVDDEVELRTPRSTRTLVIVGVQ